MPSLREVRRGQLVSIEELSARSGVSTKTIVETELGRSVPRLRTIKKLCDALGVEPASVEEFAQAISSVSDATKKLAA